MTGQFVFPFGAEPALGREDFIVAPCNKQAVQFIRRWPDWAQPAAALYGPAGCGKTHLAAIWREAAGAEIVPARELAVRLSSFAGNPATPWVVEDLDQGELDITRARALLSLFERPAGSLLLTGREPPSAWPATIGDLKSRFDALIGFAMWAPDDALLSALVVKHFSDRQLEAPAAVIKRIITHVERTPEAIARFVARTDQKALSEKRAITERLILELIDVEEQAPTRG
jgi:chromosomal replication initiation ATPase DnaA